MLLIKNLLIFLFVAISWSPLWASTLAFPASAPDADRLLKRVFGDFGFYFYQLSINSVITYSDNGCRLYHYKKRGHRTSDGVPVDIRFQFCIIRKYQGDTLHEVLKFHTNGRKAGLIRIARQGEGITPTPDQKLFSFSLPTPSKSQNYTIDFSNMGFRLDFEQGVGFRHLNTLLGTIRVTVADQLAVDQITRNYRFESPHFHRSMLVKVDQGGTGYYHGSSITRITPHEFSTELENFLFTFTRRGKKIKRKLVENHGWPDI